MGSKMVFDLATAQAEISRLTQRAEKAEAERDAALEQRDTWMQRAMDELGGNLYAKAALKQVQASHLDAIQQYARVLDERDECRLQLRRMEGFDCCTCFPCAIHSIETEQPALAARDAAKVAEAFESTLTAGDSHDDQA